MTACYNSPVHLNTFIAFIRKQGRCSYIPSNALQVKSLFEIVLHFTSKLWLGKETNMQRPPVCHPQTHTQTHTHTNTHTHARTHARTHTHSHTLISKSIHMNKQGWLFSIKFTFDIKLSEWPCSNPVWELLLLKWPQYYYELKPPHIFSANIWQTMRTRFREVLKLCIFIVQIKSRLLCPT